MSLLGRLTHQLRGEKGRLAVRISGTRREWSAALGAAIIAGAFAAVVAVAAVAAIDFTGHWAGTGTEHGKSPATLIADLTSSGKKITGTLSSTQDGQTTTCQFTGKQRGKTHIKANLGACKIVLHGAFDSTTDTITGNFVRHGGHKTHKGSFTLTRSPSGAFLDDESDVF